MTRHTLKCPHCKSIVNRVTGSPSYIGNPFHKCPFCGCIYVDSFTKEWITKSPFSRVMFIIDVPLLGAFLSMIPITALLSAVNLNIIWSLSVAVACAAVIFVGLIFARKSSIQEMKMQSLKRTKSSKYIQMLKSAGFKIYPIAGAEIGTIQDDEDFN